MTDIRIPSLGQFLAAIRAIDVELQDSVQMSETQALKERQASLAWRALRSVRMGNLDAADQENVVILKRYIAARAPVASNKVNNHKRAGSEHANMTQIAEKRVKVT